MSEEYEKKIAELQRQIDELKAAQKPKEPFVPKEPWQPIDWTAGMRMPASAAQEMARVVHGVKREPQSVEQVQSSWARSRISGPGGFGPPKWEEEKKPQVPKAEPPTPKDTRNPQTRIFDDMVDYWAGGPNDTSKLR